MKLYDFLLRTIVKSPMSQGMLSSLTSLTAVKEKKKTILSLDSSVEIFR